MSTYKRFEDFPVWQTAATLFDRMDDLLGEAPPRMRHSFRDQLERATLSVSNNIAEGFERGTICLYLYCAWVGGRGSLDACAPGETAVGLKFQISDLRVDCAGGVMFAATSRLG